MRGGGGGAGAGGVGPGAGPGAGEGGGAGSCERHSHCSDGLFCNGLERCEAGRCTPGSNPCETLAGDGCDTECVESTDECLLRASDSDGDGALSDSCPAEPGDDCDDGEASVHPRATEVCDGLDNDCNGLADLADGLALGGTIEPLPEIKRIDLAWSPALNAFGVALGRFFDGLYSLEYAPLTREGELGEPVSFFSGTMLNTPRILSNGEGFGMLSREWPCSEPDTEGCIGRRAIFELSARGAPMTPLVLSEGREYVYDFGRIGGKWAFVLTSDGIAYAGRVEAENDISLSAPLNAEGTIATSPRMAFDAERAAVAWREGTSAIKWSSVSDTLELSGPHEIETAAAGGLAIGVIPEGYAIAWNAEGGLLFQRSGLDGAPVCEPTFAAFGDPSSTGASLALSDSSAGTLVLAVDGERRWLSLFRFGTECELIDRSVVVNDGEDIANPVIATGEGAVALGWSATTDDFTDTAFYRVFGGRLCD